MKLSRQIQFRWMVVTPQDLVRLADLVTSLLPQVEEENTYSSYELDIVYFDGSKVTFESPPTNLSQYFDKRITDISFAVYVRRKGQPDYRDKANIYLAHGEGQGAHSNGAVISGEDERWINDIYERLKRWSESTPKQFLFFRRFGLLLGFVIGVPLGIVFFDLVVRFGVWVSAPNPSPKRDTTTRSDIVALLTFFSVVYGIATLFVLGVITNLVPLWPPMEIQIGPEHQLSFMEKRKKISFIWGSIVVPVLAAALWDLMKYIGLR